MEDGRGKLGLRARLELVQRIEAGDRWWHRWKAATVEEQASRSCLRSRPPVPRSCPWRLSVEAERRILNARERTNLGPARLAGIVGFRRSTIYKVLDRHGQGRRRRSPKIVPPTRRYEWAEPGALLHLDVKHLTRFEKPGHWTHGDRSEQHKSRGAGTDYAHCVIDDRTRLAYVEIHPHDRGETAATVIRRAAAWFSGQGCGPTEAVMTDNAMAYKNRAASSRRPFGTLARSTS